MAVTPPPLDRYYRILTVTTHDTRQVRSSRSHSPDLSMVLAYMVVMLLDALMPSGFWTVVRVVRHNFYCCSVCDPMVLYLMRRRLESVLVFVVERGGRRAL